MPTNVSCNRTMFFLEGESRDELNDEKNAAFYLVVYSTSKARSEAHMFPLLTNRIRGQLVLRKAVIKKEEKVRSIVASLKDFRQGSSWHVSLSWFGFYLPRCGITQLPAGAAGHRLFRFTA